MKLPMLTKPKTSFNCQKLFSEKKTFLHLRAVCYNSYLKRKESVRMPVAKVTFQNFLKRKKFKGLDKFLTRVRTIMSH